jgi:hypothetical protein
MSKNFAFEKEGQLDFFNKFGIADDTAVIDSTDGIRKGCIFEFKLTINNLNKVLFQSIKYLSKERIKGHNVPATILLVDLNAEIAYKYNSDLFLNDIEKIYIGSASKNNDGFDTKIKSENINYSKPNGIGDIATILEDERFTKINIDMFCVIGWAERFYNENPKATKIEMFQELRNPKHFKDFIYEWKGEEQDFKYIMDCLNDKMHKKELGAFYTPKAYCKKATELVRKAISQIPHGHDYIILDRTAGTGNLEEFLTDKQVDDITIGELNNYLGEDIIEKYLKDKQNIINLIEYTDFDSITVGQFEEYKTKINIHDYLFDNELSHCIVNTYELKEWIVLNERIGDKVKMIIPPPVDINNEKSTVKGGDALKENFILGNRTSLLDLSDEYYEAISELNGHVKNPNINIVMFENPPYRNDIAGNDRNNGEVTKMNERSFVFNEMSKVLNTFSNTNISTVKGYIKPIYLVGLEILFTERR